MVARYLRTSELAAAVGIHPNTVRLYEAWGFLPPVPRDANGYRRFDQSHLDSLRVARTLLRAPFPGGKEPALAAVQRLVAGDPAGALAEAECYLANVLTERARAEEAAALVARWQAERTDGSPLPPRGRGVGGVGSGLRIGEAAAQLGTTTDALRNWRRNGLYSVPRERDNRYRLYPPALLDRLRVIRALGEAGYSQMAILRMLNRLDAGPIDGAAADPRALLDTPAPDEDARYVTDRWLTTLAEQSGRAREAIRLLREIVERA
jgi:DNA-binding transcriptional MerR regulator